MHPPSTPTYPFSPVERARLVCYRLAVQAGLYTDHGPEARFTAAQIARLLVYRGAMAAGLYADFPQQGGRIDLP
jgi:hypothetical protein